MKTSTVVILGLAVVAYYATKQDTRSEAQRIADKAKQDAKDAFRSAFPA